MSLGLLIIIVIGGILYLYSSYKMIKECFTYGKSSCWSDAGLLINFILIIAGFSFGLSELFKWLFTIKLW